jgi:hypothetical protein
MPERVIGTAGWNIPRAHAPRFPSDGSQLHRYAERLNAAETRRLTSNASRPRLRASPRTAGASSTTPAPAQRLQTP